MHICSTRGQAFDLSHGLEFLTTKICGSTWSEFTNFSVACISYSIEVIRRLVCNI